MPKTFSEILRYAHEQITLKLEIEITTQRQRAATYDMVANAVTAMRADTLDPNSRRVGEAYVRNGLEAL